MRREFTHWAVEPFELDREFRYPDPDTFKPVGFWVSEGTEWPDWCRDNYHCGDVGYSVELDMDNVKLLDTVESVTDFTKEFGVVPEWMRRSSFNDFDMSRYVDWRVVQDRWSGIVFSPYHWNIRFDTLWYYGLDCASGCVWDLDAITNIERLVLTPAQPKEEECPQ